MYKYNIVEIEEGIHQLELRAYYDEKYEDYKDLNDLELDFYEANSYQYYYSDYDGFNYLIAENGKIYKFQQRYSMSDEVEKDLYELLTGGINTLVLYEIEYEEERELIEYHDWYCPWLEEA
jgi:hypothetical protein